MMLNKTKSLSLRPTKQQTETAKPTAAAANNDLNIKLILTNYLNQAPNSKYEYDYFLAQLKQKQSDGTFLHKAIVDLKECMQFLEPTLFENLINSLYFDVKWYLHLDLLSLYSEFLSDLISAYTQYIHKCLSFLIKTFLITKVTDPTVDIDCDRLYEFSHGLIQSLVKIAPTCKLHIVKLLDTYAPYMIKDTCIQEAYVRNSLQLANNLPDMRLQILEICIQKMLKIDVNAPRDQIINAEFTASTETEPKSDEMQIDGVVETTTAALKHPFADRLDAVMVHLFEFINKKCKQTKAESSTAAGTELDWNECKAVYKDLLYTFDKYILRTYGSSHVQFLLFHICSYRTSLSEGYLDYLWKKFSNPNTCPITRQLCTYYIGSFLSRANYIPLSTIVASMQLMCTWLLNYIDKIDASKSYPNIDLHRTFYALCQTVFYIFIFRHRELLSANLMDTVKSWKFSVICSSKLNPLRFCLPTITKKFASLARLYQLAYCYTIIDTNNRLTLPSIGDTSAMSINAYTSANVSLRKFFNTTSIDSSFTDTSNTLDSNNNASNLHQDNPLDSFFPFDPYLLTRSKVFIEHLYQNYHSNEDDDEDDMVTDEDSDSDDDESDDDDDDDDEDRKPKHHNPWSEDDEI